MSINHRAEALRLTEEPHGILRPNDEGPCEADRLLAEAQVHATLARDEEQAATTADLREALHSLRRRYNDTRTLVAAHIAEGLASREKDRWKAAIELTKALDEAHNNVDDLVDARLSDDGWDPRSAYKTPAGGSGWLGTVEAAPEPDPWASAPQPTDEGAITGPWGPGVTRHQAAMNVVTLHLAEALLDSKSEEVRAWARGLAHELKRERIDLLDEIGRHMQRMAFGGPTNEVPF